MATATTTGALPPPISTSTSTVTPKGHPSCANAILGAVLSPRRHHLPLPNQPEPRRPTTAQPRPPAATSPLTHDIPPQTAPHRAQTRFWGPFSAPATAISPY